MLGLYPVYIARECKARDWKEGKRGRTDRVIVPVLEVAFLHLEYGRTVLLLLLHHLLTKIALVNDD